MFIRGAHRESNQRTKTIISTEIAERNAAPIIVCDVNRSVMPQHEDRTWKTCRYEASREIRIDCFRGTVAERGRSGEITLQSALIIDEIMA